MGKYNSENTVQADDTEAENVPSIKNSLAVFQCWIVSDFFSITYDVDDTVAYTVSCAVVYTVAYAVAYGDAYDVAYTVKY